MPTANNSSLQPFRYDHDATQTDVPAASHGVVQPVHPGDVDGVTKPNLSTFCTARFEPEVESEAVSGPSAEASGSIVAAGLSNLKPGIGAAPLSTPRRVGLQEVVGDGELGCLSLLDQSVVDFVSESHEQIQKLRLGSNTQQACLALLGMFGGSSSEECENTLRRSDGSQLISLLEEGYSDRLTGTVSYTLTAIAFAKWYTSQGSDLSLRVRMMISNPRSDNGRDRGKKTLATGLACGLKWWRLVNECGFGILLKSPWQLAKAEDHVLDELVRGLLRKPKKMAVLGLLQVQFKLALTAGMTDPDRFLDDIAKKTSLWSPFVTISIDNLCQQLQEHNSSDMVLLEDSGFTFSIGSLRTLGGKEWLNADIILACLHLSDKLPFVRVGFSIPTHGNKGPLQRPFERAAARITQWQREGEGRSPLIYLFPLFQRGNHFSLLEVNEKENSIFHYDSLPAAKNAVIKTACQREFPHLQYCEKLGGEEGLRQHDAYSCGPLVISFGRSRMLGLPIISKYDGRELRAEAMQVLRSGFKMKRLIAVPVRKRKATVTDQEFSGAKSKMQKKEVAREARL